MDKLNINKNEEGKTSETQISTTTFIADTEAVKVDHKTDVLLDDISIRLQGITDFMAKPFLVFNSVWINSVVQGTTIATIDTDSLLNTVSLWNNKVKGFRLVRANLVARLVINANPFQQGKLLMHFLPNQQTNLAFNTDYVNTHNYDITMKRMQPCVELDANETEAQLVIPYVTPSNFYTIGTVTSSHPSYERGSVYISVLSPLQSGTGGDTVVDFSVYYHWEDVELAAPVLPQMNRTGGGTRIAKAVHEKELNAATGGTISGALASVSSAASSLSSIPILKSIMRPASWVLTAAAGLASSFGYAKPAVDTAPVVVSRNYNRYAQNYDGVDVSVPLGMSSRNHVTYTVGKTINDVDEMSWPFLRQVSTVVDSFVWNKTDAVGAVLYTKDIGPTNISALSSYTKTPFVVSVRTGPPVYYLSNIFRQYRGSIDTTMKIVKTDYHTGRLQITFTPIVSDTIPSGAAIPDLYTGQYALREIIDIRDGSEICLNLPYLFGVDYLKMGSVYGTLTVTVLNVLRAPETCSTFVNTLVYFSGGKDLEYAVPSAVGQWKQPVVPQMDGGNVMCNEKQILDEHGVGAEPIKDAGLRYAQYDVGEIFTSVRQLLMRFSQFYIPDPATSVIRLWPYFTGMQYVNTATGLIAPPTGGDLYGFIAPMYAYYRGGVRIQVANNSAANKYNVTLAPNLFDTATAPTVNTGGVSNGGGSLGAVWYSTLNTNQPIAVNDADIGIGNYAMSIPYYSRTPVSLNMLYHTQTMPKDETQSQSIVQIRNINANFTSETLSRAVAEDFQFLYFIGCPPTLISVV